MGSAMSLSFWIQVLLELIARMAWMKSQSAPNLAQLSLMWLTATSDEVPGLVFRSLIEFESSTLWHGLLILPNHVEDLTLVWLVAKSP